MNMVLVTWCTLLIYSLVALQSLSGRLTQTTLPYDLDFVPGMGSGLSPPGWNALHPIWIVAIRPSKEISSRCLTLHTLQLFFSLS